MVWKNNPEIHVYEFFFFKVNLIPAVRVIKKDGSDGPKLDIWSKFFLIGK